MLITPEHAAELHGLCTRDVFWSDKKLKAFLVHTGDKYMVDAEALNDYYYQKHKKEDYILQMTALADYVIALKGEDFFYSKINKKDKSNVKKGIAKEKLSHKYAQLIAETFSENFMKLYEEDYKEEKTLIPFEEREPLTASYVITHYWQCRETTTQIGAQLNVPRHWVEKEIARLGLGKRANGIRFKGRQGYVTPAGWAEARQNQPHRKAVVQIDPYTFEVVQTFRSTGAVEEGGFNRENVRRAIKRMGVHRGFLWAHKGMEGAVVKYIDRDKFYRKLKSLQIQTPTKEQMIALYANPRITNAQIAKTLGVHPNTVAQYAYKYGIKKREKKLDIAEITTLYIDKNMMAKEIAALFQVSPKTISSYLSRAGVKKNQGAKHAN